VKFSAHILRHTWASNFRRFKAGDLLDIQEEADGREKAWRRWLASIRNQEAFDERERITPLAGMLRRAS